MAEPFEFSEIQAEPHPRHDARPAHPARPADLEEEMAKLRETIAELEAILNDDAQLRGVIKTELAEVRAEFATPRRAEITFDAGDCRTSTSSTTRSSSSRCRPRAT